MRYLIRFISRRSGGSVEYRDRVFEGDIVTLGRATDQVLHLKDRRVGLSHARITPADGGFQITSQALTGINVNGRTCREARLQTGDAVELGANILAVIDPPDNFDFAFTFELNPEAKGVDVASPWDALDLAAVVWGKRRWSWVLAIVVLAIFLALPAAGLLHPDVAGALRGMPLPDDGLWLTGPLHAMHTGANATCQDCHFEPFVRVRDDQCLACHEARRHVARDPSGPDENMNVLGQRRCATCHLEHNEPPALVRSHQGLCADCHANLAARMDEGLPNVMDFLESHPEFRVSLERSSINDQGELAWGSERMLLSADALEERSNLRFSHSAHLNPDGIITPDGGRVLDCSECHRLEPGGGRMEPIAMESHCAGCHTLSFDPADPSREVPHGDPQTVVQALVEYYSARLLGGEPTARGSGILRPGRTLTPAERDRAAAEASDQAMAVAADLFERRTCATCHQVSSVEGELPWTILPVRLTSAFFPHARFSHEAHNTETSACVDCHAAAESETSGDVLMPSVEHCRDCHGSAVVARNGPGQTPSPCILCHEFHVTTNEAYP